MSERESWMPSDEEIRDAINNAMLLTSTQMAWYSHWSKEWSVSLRALIREAVGKAVAAAKEEWADEIQAERMKLASDPIYARDALIFALGEEIGKRTRKADALRAGLRAAGALMNESRGVVGLHLNGDEAPWEELRTGGRFEEWLLDFDAALAAMDAEPKG